MRGDSGNGAFPNSFPLAVITLILSGRVGVSKDLRVTHPIFRILTGNEPEVIAITFINTHVSIRQLK